MKAAVLTALENIELQELPLPEIDDSSALVKVHACSICGSDIRIFHFGNRRVIPPQTLGHEAAGEVVAVGKNVTRVKVGDRVAIGGDVPCGECAYCQDGMGTNCAINYAMGYQFAGSLAEYVLLNKRTLDHGPVHVIPDGVTYGEAALAEPLACILNGFDRTPVYLGDMVVIIGAGPVGCLMVQLSKLMGAEKVIVVQRSKARVQMALDSGADVVICSAEEDALARVLEETDGAGANLVITANSSGETHAQALQMLANRGRANYFGGLPKGTTVELDTNLIHYKELLVTGSHGALPSHHRKAVELIGSEHVDVSRFISHYFSLDEVLEAFATAEGRKGARVVVQPWGPDER